MSLISFCTWVLLLTTLVDKATAFPKVIKIGGLFDDEDDEQELAFRLAVDWINEDKTILPKTKLVAQVERIQDGDCYEATKRVCDLLWNGTAAIFGPQNPMTSLHVGNICDELEVPHVETRWKHQRETDDLSINLYPTPSDLSNWYVTVVKDYLNWKNFTLIYDKNEGIIRLQKFLQDAQYNEWNVQIYKANSSESYRKLFWKVKQEFKALREEDQKIVLDIDRRHLFTALKQAQQVGMMTENQQYLITCLDLHTIDLNDFKYAKSNITGFRLVKENSPGYQRLMHEIIARTRSKRKAKSFLGIRTETALMYDAVRMFTFALRNLNTVKKVQKFPKVSCKSGTSRGTDGTSIINYMKSKDMKGISGLVTFDGRGFRSIFEMDLMFLWERGFVKLGTLIPPNHINITINETIHTPYVPLNLIVTTKIDPPYVRLTVSSQTLSGNDRYEGYCIDLVKELSRILHFTYEIREVKDDEFGQENGTTWTGMIGEVKRGEVDMAIGGLSINSKRSVAVDFTHPFLNTGISIMFKKPTAKTTSLFSFLFPFSAEVWIYLMGFLFGVSIFTYFIGRLSPYEWMCRSPCTKDKSIVYNEFNIRNSLWFNIGSLLQQGSDLVPTAFSTRMAVSFWSFMALIMYSSYKANLVAFLTVEKPIYPFKNVEELAAQKKVKYGCVNSGTTKDFFRDNKLEIYKKIWQGISENPNAMVEDSKEGIKRVKEGDYAFFTEAATIEYYVERDCEVTQIGQFLDHKGYGIATNKENIKLTSMLSSGILTLQENGVLHELKQRWWKQKGGGKCIESSSPASIPELDLDNVGGVFLVLIVGMGIAVLLALCEFKWKTMQWENPDGYSFWALAKRELQYLSNPFNVVTKPMPKLKTSRSTSASLEDHLANIGNKPTISTNYLPNVTTTREDEDSL